MSDGLIERLDGLRKSIVRGTVFSPKFLEETFTEAISALESQEPRLPKGMKIGADIGGVIAIEYIDGTGFKYAGVVASATNFPFYNFLSAFLPTPETVEKPGKFTGWRGPLRDWVDDDPSIPVTRAELETWLLRKLDE